MSCYVVYVVQFVVPYSTYTPSVMGSDCACYVYSSLCTAAELGPCRRYCISEATYIPHPDSTGPVLYSYVLYVILTGACLHGSCCSSCFCCCLYSQYSISSWFALVWLARLSKLCTWCLRTSATGAYWDGLASQAD